MSETTSEENIINVNLTLQASLLTSLGVGLEALIRLNRHGSQVIDDTVVHDVKNLYLLLSTGYVRENAAVAALRDLRDLAGITR